MTLDISNTTEEEEVLDYARVGCPKCGEVDWEFWTEVKTDRVYRYVRLVVDEVPRSLVDEDDWITDSDENAKRLSPNHIHGMSAEVCTCGDENPEVFSDEDVVKMLKVLRIECGNCGHVPRIEQDALERMFAQMDVC